MASGRPDDRPITIRLGPEELVIRHRYEVVSTANDILIAAWFIVGSVLFFSPASTTIGTVCFLLGSIELLIRPIIRLSRRIHLSRFDKRWVDAPHESDQDF